MYENLSHLLGAYLHQDFDLDHGSPDDAVRAFAAAAPDMAASALDEVAELLADAIPEARLSALLHELGSYYRVEADGYTARTWLAHARDVLADEVARRGGFRVIVTPGALTRTEAGETTGPVWVRVGAVEFPSADWWDRPARLLADWLSRLDPATATSAVTLAFPQGPYELVLRPAGDEAWTVRAHASGGPPVAEATVGRDIVHDAVHSAAVAIGSYGRSRDWAGDPDVRTLLNALGAA